MPVFWPLVCNLAKLIPRQNESALMDDELKITLIYFAILSAVVGDCGRFSSIVGPALILMPVHFLSQYSTRNENVSIRSLSR